MLDNIPQEVQVDILSRLPVKSLLRCKSVCKRLRSIISSLDFMNTHLANSSKRPSSFVLTSISGDERRLEQFSLNNNSEVVDYIEVEFPWVPRKTPMIVGACYGLVCLSLNDTRSFSETILWNPSIRKFYTLPYPRRRRSTSESICFGFDLKSKDYKVARICYLSSLKRAGQMPSVIVDVYALSTGRWKSAAADPSLGGGFGREQVYRNGACVCIKSGLTPKLLSFDLGEEEFQLMDIPQEVFGPDTRPSLQICLLQDMVAVSQYHYNWHCTVSLWVMRQFGVAESWTKLYRFDLQEDLDPMMMKQFYGCYFVESLAGSLRWNWQGPPRHAEFVSPVWLSQEGEEEATKNNLLSITCVRGNLVDFLLPG